MLNVNEENQIIHDLKKKKTWSFCDHMCTCVFSAVQNLGRPYWLTLSPMYLWMLVFFTRPHKEERFLFPIYPLICLSGAVALSSLQVCDMYSQAQYSHVHTYMYSEIDRLYSTLCRNATTSCSSDIDWNITLFPQTGWL